RGLRAQDVRLVEVEGVARRPRGVCRRERELVEVELDRLDFAVVPDLVAEAEERVLDDAPDLGDRVEVTDRQLLARQGDVDHLIAQPAVELRVLEHPFPLGDGRLETLPDPVQEDATVAVAYAAQRLRELALAAQK